MRARAGLGYLGLAVVAACGGETFGVEQLVRTDGGAHTSRSGTTASAARSSTPSVVGTGARAAASSDSTEGTLITTGASTSAPVKTTTGSGRCVDIAITAADLECRGTTDCMFVPVPQDGRVCSGQCQCGAAAVNSVAGNRIESRLTPINFADCPCPAFGEPRCIKGHCTICGPGPDQPVGCGDAGADGG